MSAMLIPDQVCPD